MTKLGNALEKRCSLRIGEFQLAKCAVFLQQQLFWRGNVFKVGRIRKRGTGIRLDHFSLGESFCRLEWDLCFTGGGVPSSNTLFESTIDPEIVKNGDSCAHAVVDYLHVFFFHLFISIVIS